MQEQNTEHKTTAEKSEQLWDLIKDIRFAMFTTKHSNGHLHARPMTTQNSKLDEQGSLWFFMSRRSETVGDIHDDSTVNVAYADPDKDAYVSVSGHASEVDDIAKKEQLWNKAAQAWFPGGPTDADLALIRVEIVHANYWDVKTSKMVQLLQMAKAAITGKPPTNMGEAGEVRMH